MDELTREKLNHGTWPDAQNVQLGNLLYQSIGNEYFLDPVNGNDSNDGLTVKTAVKTLAVGYALLTANQNDTLYIIQGASSLPLTTGFTWHKAYTHLIGLTFPAPYSRCRIQSNAIIASLFTIDVNGCVFKNIHWQQGEGGDATSVNCVVLSATANQNYFENCHFDAPLLAAAGTAAYRVLTLSGSGTTGARSNTFKNCWFGDWTAAPVSTTGQIVNVNPATAGNQFIDCTFIINTTQVTMVAIAAAVDVGGGNPPGYILFENCKFLALATGINVLATAPTTGKLVFVNCTMAGVAAWSASSSNVLITAHSTADADEAGIGVAQD
jgi:hypothetical protein